MSQYIYDITPEQITVRLEQSLSEKALLLLGATVPLMAPYELLIRPVLDGRFGSLLNWLLVGLIVVPALGISATMFYAAIFGGGRVLTFQRSTRTLHIRHRYGGHGQHPFESLRGLDVVEHKWESGPRTYGLDLTLPSGRPLVIGDYPTRAEAEAQRRVLMGFLRGTGPQRSEANRVAA